VVSALADIEEAKLDLTHPGRSPLGLTRERIRRAHGTLIQTEKDMDNIASAGVTSSHASRFLESVGARYVTHTFSFYCLVILFSTFNIKLWTL